MSQQDEAERHRREILRRASRYTLIFFLAGVGVALIGTALIALLLRLGGLPFLETWLILAGAVVGVALAGVLIQSWRSRRRGGPGHRKTE